MPLVIYHKRFQYYLLVKHVYFFFKINCFIEAFICIITLSSEKLADALVWISCCHFFSYIHPVNFPDDIKQKPKCAILYLTCFSCGGFLWCNSTSMQWLSWVTVAIEGHCIHVESLEYYLR